MSSKKLGRGRLHTINVLLRKNALEETRAKEFKSFYLFFFRDLRVSICSFLGT